MQNNYCWHLLRHAPLPFSETDLLRTSYSILQPLCPLFSIKPIVSHSTLKGRVVSLQLVIFIIPSQLMLVGIVDLVRLGDAKIFLLTAPRLFLVRAGSQAVKASEVHASTILISPWHSKLWKSILHMRIRILLCLGTDET
ncbi:hypothetical protein O6H91_Y489000 [Diphasiastrum complanatum]|nr:hypothetical protein O6H91_Y489000 [Diphasiastrum complanatum]